MLVKIIFEENSKVVLEKAFPISEDLYPDGKRMLSDSFAFDMPKLLSEVEDIINNDETQF